MTDIVWVGYEYDIGEQGYQADHTSEPQHVFSDITTADKWKKLGRNRKLKKLYITKTVKCHTCESIL